MGGRIPMRDLVLLLVLELFSFLVFCYFTVACLKHESPSPAPILESWVRILLEALIFVCVHSFSSLQFMLCVSRCLETCSALFPVTGQHVSPPHLKMLHLPQSLS
jgi:hypothetical protein